MNGTSTEIDVEVLKKHYPSCAKIFDQIVSKVKSEQEYKLLLKGKSKFEDRRC